MGIDTDKIRQAIRLAKGDREHLTPIVGAGLSIPLGLPSWPALVHELSMASSLRNEPPSPSPEALRDLKADLGEANFVARVQHALHLPSDVTSKALQALVSARLTNIITTNLDTAIETAFLKAGKPLELIGRGHTAEELSLLKRFSGEPTLLKIHGSLERPSTWVLTVEEYDKAYHYPGDLKEFLATNIHTPLFLGFSFTDSDLGQGLRLGSVRWKNHAYALLRHEEVQQLGARLKTFGVIPIPFHTFDHIPEIIDEIFGCSPLTISWTSDNHKDSTLLRIAGADIQIPPALVDFTEKNDALNHALVRTLANALEVQPNKSFLHDTPRRQHSLAGEYKLAIRQMLQSGQHEVLQLTLEALAQYPETLFEGLVSWLMERSGLPSDEDYFVVYKLAYQSLSDRPGLLARLDSLLMRHIHDSELPYPCLRAIAKTLAQRKLHPALRLPPQTVLVENFQVPIYPLTEHQVAALRGEAVNNVSIRPYLLRSIEEGHAIVARLSAVTGQTWRLPTASEWKKIAEISEARPWPWGSDPPQYRIHAHLNYIAMKGKIAEHTLEVGLFPKGQSSRGILDLIGNVHELVTHAFALDSYGLAGGAWTSRFNTAQTFRLIAPLHTRRENAGIRPILEAG